MNEQVSGSRRGNSSKPQQYQPRISLFYPWSTLLCILILYAVGVAALHPVSLFGQMEDDSIYFSSAKSLALGHGHVLPSLPGTPPATKYPILYSWMLSWIWRANPSFPANLAPAFALNVLFGGIFLTAAFALLRMLTGMTNAAALAITAFCAANPVVRVLSAELMSDIPFAALTTVALWLAAPPPQRQRERRAIASGMTAGASILLRMLGAPVALGIFLAIAIRDGWRRAMMFMVGAFPLVAVSVGRTLLIKPAAPAMVNGACAHSWRVTWLYYTSYLGFWKEDVLGNHALLDVAKNGISNALMQPGSYLVDAAGFRPALLAIIFLFFLGAIAIRGMARQFNDRALLPLHLGLWFYLLPLIVWDYANFARFLLPFFPFIVAGFWLESKRLIAQISATMTQGKRADERVAGAFFCLIGCALVIGGSYSWWRGTKRLAVVSHSRSELLSEKRQGYEWLRNNTASESKVLAYEDASLFLYSGRLAIRPVIFSPAGYYHPEVLRKECSCLASIAGPTGATYWMIAEDDFSAEWEPAGSRGKEAEAERESELPQLFRSTQGRVRIYKVVGLPDARDALRMLQTNQYGQ